jgi:hypothetical protein
MQEITLRKSEDEGSNEYDRGDAPHNTAVHAQPVKARRQTFGLKN